MDKPLTQRGMIRSQWHTVLGWNMFARAVTGPPGPPVVLVHGLGVSSRYMVPLLEQLRIYRSAFAPDLPGFGQSQRPAHTLNLGELAMSLLAWLDAADIPQAIFLGNSLGAQILVEAAVREPQRFERLVLVGPTVDAQARSAPRQILRLLRDGLLEPLSLVWIAATDYLRCSPRRLWKTLQFAIQHRIEDQLARVTCPTLVVRGTQDPLVPERWAELVAERLPHGILRVVPGTHALHYARPATLMQLVAPLLGPLDTAPCADHSRPAGH